MALDPVEKRRRLRAARNRVHAHRRRAGQLRSRVVAASLISFALLWGLIFVQMATGNDPVLGRSAANVAGAVQESSGSAEDRRRARLEAALAAREETIAEGPPEVPEEVEPEPEAVIVEPEPEAVITGQS